MPLGNYVISASHGLLANHLSESADTGCATDYESAIELENFSVMQKNPMHWPGCPYFVYQGSWTVISWI